MSGAQRMAETHTHSHDHNHVCCYKCVSWSAVLVGAFIAIGLSFLLNLFGIAIGLSAFASSSDGSSTFAIGGFIGLAIASIVAMFLSGWATGFISRPICPKRNHGILYGITTWSVALIIGILLASSINSYVVSRADFTVNPNLMVVKMSNNQNAATATAKEGEGISQVTVNAEKVAGTLATGAYVTFFLFFLGAIATCFGAHCGLTGCKKEGEDCK